MSDLELVKMLPNLAIGFGGILLFITSVVILKFGKIIQDMPGSGITNSLSSPKNACIITVIFSWIIYLIGCGLILSPDKILFIVGVVSIFTANLVTVHTVIFSAAVYSKITTKSNILGD